MFRLLYYGARLLGPPKFNGAARRSEVKPGNGIPRGMCWTIAVISAVVIAIMMATGLSNGLLTACIIVFPVLIAGSWMFRGVSGAQSAGKAVADLPDPIRPAYSAKQMRSRAAELHQPEPRPEPDAHVVKPVRKAMTYRQIQADADLNERLMRVAAILVSPCPACGAGEAEFCKYLASEPTYMLDRDRTIVVHGLRIGKAIKTQTAKVTDVVAQFNGHVPDDVWAAAL